jgi:alpha(1,3/1,4) fucosyltransferase
MSSWLFIDPPSRHFEQDRLFGSTLPAQGGIGLLEPFAYLRRHLREAGVNVHTADLIDSVSASRHEPKAYISFGMRGRYPQLAKRADVVLSALFAFECPIVEPRLYRALHPAQRYFRRLFSFSTPTALAPFLTGEVELLPFRIPQFFDEVDETLWKRRDRRFLVMVNANKVPPLTLNELYTERLRALAHFAGDPEVDLFGFGWDGPVLRVGDRRMPRSLRRAQHELQRRLQSWRPPGDEISRAIRSTYRGTSPDKAATLAGYTFSLCFENSILEGWVTEKIFDCFYSGTVPVYLGAPDIERWVPTECFVDVRRFSDYAELRSYLLDLTPAEIETFRVAARDFVRSARFRPFTKRAFAERIAQILAEDLPAASGGLPGAAHT